jgi:hypothetical protein
MKLKPKERAAFQALREAEARLTDLGDDETLTQVAQAKCCLLRRAQEQRRLRMAWALDLFRTSTRR